MTLLNKPISMRKNSHNRRRIALAYAMVASAVVWSAFSVGVANAQPVPTGPQPVATGPLPVQSASATKLASRGAIAKPAAKPPVDIRASSPEEYVTKLVAEMSLAEKIGQLCQIFPEGEEVAQADVEAIRSGEVGSIFFTGNPQQVRELQRVALEETRLGIPLVVARDVIHGFRTIFPIPIGQASSWNPEIVEEAAEVAASESRKVGIHWTFAPMVDISRDPRWGRIAESCGEDPHLSSAVGAAMVRGLQMPNSGGLIQGIAACPKHFVAYGQAEGGRDYNRVMVSKNELCNVYLPPFQSCIDAGAASLMTAFNTVNGVPASGHQPLVRQKLKQEFGFQGMVVSDWASISEMIAHGYSADSKQAAAQAMQAGVDMEMVSTCYKDNLRDLLATNEIQIEMVDEAVRRILMMKMRLNLYVQPYADEDEPELLNDDHKNVARRMAQQSMVLLKNDSVLPLDRSALKKVAVIGPFSDAQEDQLGCWVQDAKFADTVTPLHALRDILGDEVEINYVACEESKYDPANTDFSEAVAAAKEADVVLLFVGEEQALSGEAHSRTELDLPGSQASLVQALGELETPVVMVVFAGRPLTIGEQAEQVEALLYAWHPGTMGGPAIVDLLLGDASPSGKLPVTFPKVTGQVPLYYNHPNTGRPAPHDFSPPALRDVKNQPPDLRYRSHYVDSDPFPLFPFGYGLGYTDFEYEDLELASQELREGQSLVVRVRVANVGDRAGVETVQLYIRDRVASVVRPVKELKQFRRVEIEAGESDVLEFVLPYESLGFYNEEEQFVVEPGEFEISVGGSSVTKLSEVVTLR